MKEEVIRVASPSRQFFTTIITDQIASSLGPLAFDRSSVPYVFLTDLPSDYWETRGGYVLSFGRTANV
jgi:hypothetical protein